MADMFAELNPIMASLNLEKLLFFYYEDARHESFFNWNLLHFIS
jgi:hypothetical protein